MELTSICGVAFRAFAPCRPQGQRRVRRRPYRPCTCTTRSQAIHPAVTPTPSRFGRLCVGKRRCPSAVGIAGPTPQAIRPSAGRERFSPAVTSTPTPSQSGRRLCGPMWTLLPAPAAGIARSPNSERPFSARERFNPAIRSRLGTSDKPRAARRDHRMPARRYSGSSIASPS